MRKFFEGFNFEPKRTAIGCFVMASPFLFLLFKEAQNYKYYFYEQPSYDKLFAIEGVISSDPRKPPRRYNERFDGIYITSGQKGFNIYCDNPTKPLISYGTKGGGTYGLGQCEWIALKRSRSGLCDKGNDELCSNPRYFTGKKISAKIDKNNTVYELYIEGKIFYQYDEMVLNYKNKFIGNIKMYLYISMILISISVGCLFFNFVKK